MDWAAHLEHLQIVFRKFNANVVILELDLIYLFRNGLRLSIRAQAKQKSSQKDTCHQAIRKVITAEAKAVLNLLFWVREIDVCCPWSHRSTSKPTEDHIRDQCSFPFCLQKAEIMLTYHFEQAKTLERLRRDHQKGKRNKNRCNCGPRDFRPYSSTPATRMNTTKVLAQNDCERNWPMQQEDKNLSQTTCYNCNKKSHFVNQCPKPRKPKN